MPAVPTDETESLISSDKVEDTSVYDSNGEELGRVFNFMVDKQSGQVEYAVVQAQGDDSRYYPIPWAALEYDENQGGYVVDVNQEFLQQAPSYGADETPKFTADYGRSIDDVYGVGYEEDPEEEEPDCEDEGDDDPATEPARGLENYVRDNPVTAAIGALVLGVVLGRIGLL